MLRKISNILIIIGIIFYLCILLVNYNIYKTNNKIVNSLIYSDITVNYYVGYIEINNKKIPLAYGTDEKELNQNIVGISKHSTKKHLVLAGHAINPVFLYLYEIDINENIIIYLNQKYYNYYVDNKHIVEDNDISIYDNEGLTLITCIDKTKRLIVHAKTAN